jgi:hypothetical protein
MYNPFGLFGRMGMGGRQQRQNPFAQRQMYQMGMPQMGMDMPSYMPPYLAQYMQQYGMPQGMQQYGMQGMGQRMPQQMMPQYGMQQYGMPQQNNPNSPYQNQFPLRQNPYQAQMPQQANTIQSRRATVVQPPMNQPMGMGSISTGAMPPPSAELQAAMAQLNAAKAAGTIPQGDTFQNNPNRPQVTLQDALNSLTRLSPRG